MTRKRSQVQVLYRPLFYALKKVAIINYKAYRESVRRLIEKGYEVIFVDPYYGGEGATASHPDLQIFPFNKGLIIAPNLSLFTLRKILKVFGEKRLSFGKRFLKEGYPDEVPYNAIIAREYLIGNLKFVDRSIVELSEKFNIIPVHVNQGYVRCTTIYLKDSGIITEDIGIFKELKKLGLKPAFFEPGGVELEGYKYGFLPGASGIDENKFYINGDIAFYPWRNELEEYLGVYGIEVESLAPGRKVRDIGSIFFINV